MSDYGHIGQALGTLALIAVGAVPVVVGLICALILALFGFKTAAIVVGVVGVIGGLALAYKVAR